MQAVKLVNLLFEISGYKCMDAIEFQGFCSDNFCGTRLITEALILSRTKRIKPSYFKLISGSEIRDYISVELA